jgi:transposase
MRSISAASAAQAGWFLADAGADIALFEWALLSPLIPPARRGGRKRSVDVREVLNAIFYVLATGCQWNALPKDLPPKSTAHFYLMCFGTGMARSNASTTRSTWRSANLPVARPAPPSRSLTLNPPRRLKKGLRD